MDIQEQIAEMTAAIRDLAKSRGSTDNVDDAVKAALSGIRKPSMAARIGEGYIDGPSSVTGATHPALKAALGVNYTPGAFLTALMDTATGGNPDEFYRGKAALEAMGLIRRDIPDGSINKATLGTTGATGGYVLPNNVVDTVEKPEVAQAVYTSGPNPLLAVRTGVAVRGVDVPYRISAPTRMTFQDWGTTKEQANETYGSYTATLGTMARIMDIGKQYARFSAGSAEADVIDELTKARDLGENYYVLAGAGTGSVGSGDPTVGIYTALTAAGLSGSFTTTFAGASNSTIAGSAATGITQALSALATRSRRATAIVTDSITYFTILAQGSDTAGFWLDPRTSGGFTINADGGLALWGVPLLHDPNFNTNTGTTKRAIAADWRAFKFYRGLEFRVESSDVAGDRWDKNLVGFRGEQEVGFSAYPGVFTGAAQLIAALIP